MLCLKCGTSVGAYAELCERCKLEQKFESTSTLRADTKRPAKPETEEEGANLIRSLCVQVISDRRLFYCVGGFFLSLFLLYFSLVTGGSSLVLPWGLSFLGIAAVLFAVLFYADAEPYDATETTKLIKIMTAIGAGGIALSLLF